jgi:hypothetical protein
LYACTKEPATDSPERTCNLTNTEVLSATINSQPWNGCEYRAVYYPYTKQLSIAAIDKNSKDELRFFITLDTISPLKSYTIGPNRTTGLEVVEDFSSVNVSSTDIYYCDLNKPAGMGGTITISKLDTLTKKMSATFNATGYSLNQKKSITIQNGIFDNIKLDTAHWRSGNGSYVSAAVNSLNWYGTDMFKQITMTIGPQNQFLELKIPGYYLDGIGFQSSWSRSYHFDAERYLSFKLPLSLGTGTFQLYPEKAPYFYQPINAQKHIFSYNVHNADEKFFPLSGTITITSIDTAKRNLDATFSTQTADTTGNIMNFTNGKIHIVKWQDI